ncbi:MAG: hypothetical protein QF903_10095 [Planctomycetota bacterium]|jgi:hypothetical protein|nr:hypothetical protein [Planctomycetota bacterium]MDP6989817.1 hypothetical protein [Planctomycetota bacterium]
MTRALPGGLRRRLFHFVLIVAAGSAGAAGASAQGCDGHPADGFTLAHRFTMFWVAGSPPAPMHADLGLFRIDAPNRKVSLRLTDPLEARLYEASVPHSVVFATEIVRDRQGVFNRSHWFGGTLEEPITLPAGDYYLMLASVNEGDRPLGYFVTMGRSSLPEAMGGQAATFGGSDSYAVSSPDGGTSFFPHPGRPDMAFVLGRVDPGEPLGIYDEGGVYHVSGPDAGQAALTAAPGETLRIKIEPRNIGPSSGSLIYDIIDEESGASLLGGPRETGEIEPNRDDPDTNEPTAAVPASYNMGGLFRIRVRIGHETLSGLESWDDEVRFEVRIQ